MVDGLNKGIRSIHNLYIKDTVASFSQLDQMYDLPNNHFFCYLQIRSFVKIHSTNFQISRQNHISTLSVNWTQIVEDWYPWYMSSLMALIYAWHSDHGIDDQWDSVLDLIHASSTSAKHSLMQLKVVHRAHLTNARLVEIYPDVVALCPRCRDQPADLMHTVCSGWVLISPPSR